MKKSTGIIIIRLILVILLIAIGGYMGYDYLQKWERETIQKAAEAGFEKAKTDVINEAITCKPFFIASAAYPDQTITLISVDCLPQYLPGLCAELAQNNTG